MDQGTAPATLYRVRRHCAYITMGTITRVFAQWHGDIHSNSIRVRYCLSIRVWIMSSLHCSPFKKRRVLVSDVCHIEIWGICWGPESSSPSGPTTISQWSNGLASWRTQIRCCEIFWRTIGWRANWIVSWRIPRHQHHRIIPFICRLGWFFWTPGLVLMGCGVCLVGLQAVKVHDETLSTAPLPWHGSLWLYPKGNV